MATTTEGGAPSTGGLVGKLDLFLKAAHWLDKVETKASIKRAKKTAERAIAAGARQLERRTVPYVTASGETIRKHPTRPLQVESVFRDLAIPGSIYAEAGVPYWWHQLRYTPIVDTPRAREPVPRPIPYPEPPPDYPRIPGQGGINWSPPIYGSAPIFRAQQGGAPTSPPPQGTLDSAMERLRRAFELRDLLLMFRGLFDKPAAPRIVIRYPQLPQPVPTPGGVNVPSMIPGFGGYSLMPGASGAGLGGGGWMDLLGQALNFGGGLASQIIQAQRPSQIPIPGPLGGIMLPGYVPEGSATVPGLFQTRERAVAQPFQVTNPITGALVYYAPRGRPILFSGDFAACRRVQRVASSAAKRCGGRRRRGR